MKFTKKLISICLSSVCFFPNICAMKSSISEPKDLSRHLHTEGSEEEREDIDTSLYNMNKRCRRIIVNASDTPVETIIKETTYICAITFEKISSLLRSKDGLNKRYYESCLLHYVPLIDNLNHILLDIIPRKIKTTDPCFPISEETKRNVRAANSDVSAALTKCGYIFALELKATFLEPTRIQQVYDLLCDTQEGVSYICDLAIFRI